MEDIKPIVAKNIARLRISQGWTQLELAEKLNYSDKAVSKWERGESLPDIAVLTHLADLFDVTLDSLVRPASSLPVSAREPGEKRRLLHNHSFITAMCVLAVWLVATLFFTVAEMVNPAHETYWMVFVYAVPASLVVWLVFNSLWFDKKLNFLIVSLLMWTILISLLVTGFLFRQNVWLIFIPGIPGQILIYCWSRLKGKSRPREE
ncbi:MAG: helix-turn-helix transcriptional regulator [Clostridia bacterium]|nr:helix-turn-helix transcriptional regulator [Clostridia bacterium]